MNNSARPYQVYADSLAGMEPSDYTSIQEEVGKPVNLEQIPELIDIAFLTLHGPYGEDGSIQGILDWLGIPYTGSDIFPSAFGINKITQRRRFEEAGFQGPAFEVVSRNAFLKANSIQAIFEKIQSTIGFPCVVKAPHQGSSIGVSIVRNADQDQLKAALPKAFFWKRFWRKIGIRNPKRKKSIGLMPCLMSGPVQACR